MRTQAIGKYTISKAVDHYARIYVSDFDTYKVTIEVNNEYKGDIICDTKEEAHNVIEELARIYERAYRKEYEGCSEGLT